LKHPSIVAPSTATLLASVSQQRAHHRSGIRRVLECAWIYALFKRLLQPPSAQWKFVAEFVRAQPGARILDIGCGTGWILDYLPGDLHYVGYDLNPNYIASAQQRFGDRGTFFCADITGQSVPQIEGELFDIVLALGLVHHLNDAEAKRLCESAHAHLKPNGVFITFDGVYAPNQSRIARYIISRDRGQAVRTPEGYLALTESLFATVKRQVRTDLLRIPYTHFLMHCYK
jgi:SAM-dependent methyltransferase